MDDGAKKYLLPHRLQGVRDDNFKSGRSFLMKFLRVICDKRSNKNTLVM